MALSSRAATKPMQEYIDALNNAHFNTFAGIFAVAMSPRWRVRHSEVASVRSRLDAIAKQLRGYNGLPESKRAWFVMEWTRLITDIIVADTALSYSTEDMDWLVSILDGDSETAKSILILLFAVASSNPRWYSCEQLSEISGLSAETWKKRAASGNWQAVKTGKTWIFPELFLRAHGVMVPSSMHLEIET